MVVGRRLGCPTPAHRVCEHGERPGVVTKHRVGEAEHRSYSMEFCSVKMETELQGEGRHPADSGVLVTGPDVGTVPTLDFLGICIAV